MPITRNTFQQTHLYTVHYLDKKFAYIEDSEDGLCYLFDVNGICKERKTMKTRVSLSGAKRRRMIGIGYYDSKHDARNC